MAMMVFSVGRLGAFRYSRLDSKKKTPKPTTKQKANKQKPHKKPQQTNLTQNRQKVQLDALDLTLQFLRVSEMQQELSRA